MDFISGLPRSGSTLLAAILSQNPRICAGVTTPVLPLVQRAITEMSAPVHAPFFDDVRRDDVLLGLIDGYYAGEATRRVIDTNRGWCAHLPLIARMFPESHVICCVRNLGWIVNSFERLIASEPTRYSSLTSRAPSGTVYARADAWMHEKTGIIGHAYAALKEAWFGDFATKLIVVDYDQLVNYPRNTVYALYERCGWPEFSHDFQNVNFSASAFDEALGAPRLHDVYGPVRRVTDKLSIPPDLFARYADSEFWKNSQANLRGATVLATHELKAVG